MLKKAIEEMSANKKESAGPQKGRIRPPIPVKASNVDVSMDQSTIITGTFVRGILKKKNSNLSNLSQFSKELENEKDHSVSSNGLKTLKDLRSASKNSTDDLAKTNNGR
jgi:hypothetical protein